MSKKRAEDFPSPYGRGAAGQPWPGELRGEPYEWMKIVCRKCGEPIGSAADFDLVRAESVTLCRECCEWRVIRCSRCNLLIGAANMGEHDAPTIYCDSCARRDAAASALKRKPKRNGHDGNGA